MQRSGAWGMEKKDSEILFKAIGQRINELEEKIEDLTKTNIMSYGRKLPKK